MSNGSTQIVGSSSIVKSDLSDISARSDRSSRAAYPAVTPSDFGMPEINWAWRQMGEGEFVDRSNHLTLLSSKAKQIGRLAAQEFSLDKFSTTVGCLRRSFGEIVRAESGFHELQRSSSTDPSRLISLGLIDHEPEPGRREPLINPGDIFGRSIGNLFINIPRYAELNPREHLYLNEQVALLLVPDRYNKNSVLVTLKPYSEQVDVDPRFFNFFDLCAEATIPFGWGRDLESLYLGNFDLTARNTPQRSTSAYFVFPQYEPGKVQERRAIFNLKLDEEAQNGSVKVEGKTDTAATLAYREATKMLDDAEKEQLFYVSLKKIGELLTPIDAHLTREQRDKIAGGIVQYVCRSLLTTNIKNLEGMESIPQSLQEGLVIPPEVAASLKKYYHELGPTQAITIASCFDQNGQILARAYDLPRPQGVSANSEAWPSLNMDVWDKYYHSLTAPPDPEHQRQLKQRVMTYMESILSPTLAKDNLIDVGMEIRYFAGLITTMYGESKGFNVTETNPIPLQLCVGVCLLLEHAIGENLPGLRSSIIAIHSKKAKDLFTLIDSGSSRQLSTRDDVRERLMLN